MPGGVWRERHEVRRGNIGHDRVVYPALETTGVLSGASSAEVALDARVDADYDTFKRGATINPLWCPPRGHSHPQPCLVGVDSHPPAILAGPHVQTNVRRVLPTSQ